jgi:hypothetical protein
MNKQDATFDMGNIVCGKCELTYKDKDAFQRRGSCDATCVGYTCTRIKGHRGDHWACGLDRQEDHPCKVWSR